MKEGVRCILYLILYHYKPASFLRAAEATNKQVWVHNLWITRRALFFSQLDGLHDGILSGFKNLQVFQCQALGGWQFMNNWHPSILVVFFQNFLCCISNMFPRLALIALLSSSVYYIFITSPTWFCMPSIARSQ